MDFWIWSKNQNTEHGVEQVGRKVHQEGAHVKIKNQKFGYHIFDIYGIILKHKVPRGQTINTVYYIEALKQLCRAIMAKQPELSNANNWLLHHDNAPAYHLFKTLKFL